MTPALDTAPLVVKPALKEPCPYCGGTGWKEYTVKGSDILRSWRCVQCSGTGFIWTEGGSW